MILISGVACQSNPPEVRVAALPTFIEFPTVTLTPRPMQAVRLGVDAPTVTVSPQQPSATPSHTISTRTITPTVTLSAIPTRPPLPDAFVFGKSVEGRDLLARRFGDGPQLMMLVGGIHGGWESNTTEMVNQLVTHFEANPGDVLPDITLLLVPALNPDGAALGRTVEGRFNSNRVDLNRNWDCGWESVAYFRDEEVDPGAEPFSEPETRALAALIRDVRPSIVLFYHSAANGVFSGDCGDAASDSAAMSAVLGRVTGYNYGSDFSAYPVTGTAPAWVSSLGIASADVELAGWQTPEFDRNLRGVMALQCWLLGANLTQCQR